jgi:hypothetical protein
MRETAEDEFPPTDPVTAAAALAHAEKAQVIANQAVRAGSAWTSRFLGAFGVASVVFFSLADVGGVVAYVASWVVYGAIATWFARREQVSWRGFERLSGRSFAAWFVLQGAGCAVGFNFFSGVAGYWVPVALVVSAPLFAGAWRAAHR